MTTGNTALLGLALPVSGELSGSWGATVNDSITSLVDSAIAGTTTLSTDADVTLTTTNLAANQARQAILLCSGARTALRTITAPARSKAYVVVNNTTGGFGVKLVGVGPTTGVTIAAGDSIVVTWNGTDFVQVNGVATATHNATSKTTPVDADELPLSDSAATFGLKKLTWANLKATLKVYFDSLTTTLTNKTIALGSNTVSGTIAQFNTACTDADFATGGGTATGTNTGDQTNISGNAATATTAAACTGNAETASNAMGVGQTWQNLSSSRAINESYTNSSGRTIAVAVSILANASTAIASSIGGVTCFYENSGASIRYVTVNLIVPSGAIYSITATGTLSSWSELR